MPENNKQLADITVPENNEVTIRANEGGTLRVLVMTNDGSGKAEYQEFPQGATVKDVAGDTGGAQQIRVNGQPATPDQQLNDGDKVTATPNRMDGAA